MSNKLTDLKLILQNDRRVWAAGGFIIVALFITSPYLKTLPVQIYTSITRDADPTVAAVGTLLFIATSLIIIAGLLLGMRRGRT